MPLPVRAPLPHRRRGALPAVYALLLLGALCQTPSAARAEEPTWYGWQTLTSDATAVGLIALGAGVGQPPVALIGLGGYLLAPPLVHLVHGNDWALWSLLLRAAGPGLVLGGVAVAFHDCPLFDGGTCDGGQRTLGALMATGGLLLTVASPILDAVLARRQTARSDVALTPWLGPRGESGGLSISGRL